MLQKYKIIDLKYFVMKLKIINLRNGLFLFSILAACWITIHKTEPFLYYHFHQSAFINTYEFFHTYAVNAGGLSDYTADFISQFFYFNQLGSILIVGIAAMFGFIALDLVTRLAGKIRFDYSVFASFLLLGVIVLCDVHYPYYATIRLLFAMLFCWGFYFIRERFSKISLYSWPLLASILFYLASGPALFVFSAVSLLIFIYNDRSVILVKTATIVLTTALLPYIGYKLFFQSTLPELYQLSVVKPPEMLAYSTFYQLFIYYALLPFLLLVSLFFRRKREEANPVTLKKGQKPAKIKLYQRDVFILTAQFAGLTAAGYFLFVQTYNPLKKNLLRIEYHAENGEWNKVLKVAEEIDKYDFKVNFHVNRAYAHLGKLPERLFAYPQLLGVNGLFLSNSNTNSSFTMPNSDLYYDLGFMSESQHWAFEGQTLMPNSPRILKRLIMINLINREYKLADEFLNVLDHNMLYRDWVAEHKRFIADTTLTNSDQEISLKRKFNPQTRYVHTNELDDLKLLFETNASNRFAYDYLIAYSILDADLKSFMTYIPYYTSFKIRTLPKSWEEALSLYIVRNKTIPSFMTEETISKSCMKRMSEFNKTIKPFNKDLASAQNTMRAGFEDTYWYYMIYLDPKKTNVLTQKAEIL